MSEPSVTPTATSELKKAEDGDRCILTGGEIVESGWSGKDTGTNWCNQCRCMDSALACTRMACSSIVSTPIPIFRPSLEPRYPVEVEKAIVYGTGATVDGNQVELLLDLAVPDTRSNALRPLFIHIHGGAFTTGSRFPQWNVAKHGWVAASIDYRLLGDNPLPSSRVQGLRDKLDETSFPKWWAVVAAVEDTLVAIDYLLNRADELAIDKDRIVLQGFSAGAFTALHVAYCVDEFGISRPPIAAVVDFAGAISKACGEGSAIDPGEAAAFIAHGTKDVGSTAFARALNIVEGATKAGITYEFHPLDGIGHMWKQTEETTTDGRTIDAAMYEFLDRVLYGK